MKGHTHFSRNGFTINEGAGPAGISIKWWPLHRLVFWAWLDFPCWNGIQSLSLRLGNGLSIKSGLYHVRLMKGENRIDEKRLTRRFTWARLNYLV
jgi:hypothetical protein